MPSRPTRLALALSLALGASPWSPVHAASITTAAVAFTGSASVTDQQGGGATANDGATLGSTLLPQLFDPALGVLVATTLNLDSSRAQTLTVRAGGSDDSSDRTKNSSGIGSSTARITAPGVAATFTAVDASASCSGKLRDGCTATARPAAVATGAALAVDPAALDAYVGSGSVTATRTAPSMSATQQTNAFPGSESTQYSLAWSGNLSLAFDYLLHAAPALDNGMATQDLDFGTVDQGSVAPLLAFGITNVAGDRVGLDLDDASFTGDRAQLYPLLTPFVGLAPGERAGFLATFDTSTAGSFAASWTFVLSDADVGAATTRLGNYRLTLNLLGTVLANSQPPNGVPEPNALALLALAASAIGWSRRRRPRVIAARATARA